MSVIRCTATQFAELTPEPGQIVYIIDSTDDTKGVLKTWTGTEWCDIKADANSEISMTSYEINQQLISQLPALSQDKIDEGKELIYNSAQDNYNQYYMLLCRDLNYYTVLKRDPENAAPNDTLEQVVIECAQYLGDIKAIDNAGNAVEIWITNNIGTYVMYFFGYDGGIELCR
jgi:hypothetical protein